jgi:hypothetical protein
LNIFSNLYSFCFKDGKTAFDVAQTSEIRTLIQRAIAVPVRPAAAAAAAAAREREEQELAAAIEASAIEAALVEEKWLKEKQDAAFEQT